MLEQGHVIADCTVIRQLAMFDSRLEYLVKTESGEEKLVQFSGSSNWSRAQRQTFHEQVKALCALSIPAVGAPTRVIDQDGELFCLYPLPSGEALLHVLTDERTVRATLELFRAISDLLEPAHRQQLFHGALSPLTVYLVDGQLFFADFSLASLVAFDDRTAVEAQYVSPEQLRGEPPGTAADVYSLGCLFYALLMGHPPFSGSDAFTVGMQHLNDSFPVLPESLAFCAGLLRGMTAKISSERVTLAQVRAQLEEMLSLEDLDQIPNRDARPASALDEEHQIQQDAMAMVARIEDQLRDIESAAADPAAATEKHPDEELYLSPQQAQRSEKPPATRWVFSLVVGLIVGFCLGALFLDLFLPGSTVAPTPTVFSVDTMAPDYTNSTHLWQQGDIDGAERELSRLLVNFPDHPQVHNNLAAIAAVRGDIEAAREWLERAIVLDPQTATIYRNLGSVYAEVARDSYGRALQFDYEKIPLQLDIFSNRGVVSSSLRADAIVQVSSSADEDVAAPVAAAPSVTLSSESLSADSVVLVSGSDDMSVVVSAVAAENAESGAAQVEIAVDSIVQQQVSGREQAVPVPATLEMTAEQHEDPALFLERWAAAWSAQDVEGYLAFYSADFVPSGGLDYDQWIIQRRERLQQPEEIMVTLTDVELRPEVNGLIQLEVIQDYRSERYSDRTRKLFDLRRQDNSWKIERERSLELIY